MNDPEKVREEGNVPELQKELAYQTLESLRDVAISCVNRAQEHLQKVLLPEEAKAIELILNIQVRCAVNVARIIEAMNKLDLRK